MDTINPSQAKYLWAFEVRNSSGAPLQWHRYTDYKGIVPSLIRDCEQYERNKQNGINDPELKATIKDGMCVFNVYFEFLTSNAQTPAPGPVPPPQEPIIKEVVKQVVISPDMKLEQIIETILPVVKGATVLQDIFDAKQLPLPSATTSKQYYKPENFDIILAALNTRKVNVLLKGPAGSGKSLMGEELAKQMGLEFFCFSCSGGMRYSHVFGGDRMFIDPATKQAITEFELSNLMQALQRPCLVLMDELFTLEANILMGLNGLFEPSNRKIETKGGLVKLDKDCVVMAATNTDGRNNDRNHVGAGRVDGSSLDRFATFQHGYSDKVEKDVLNALPKLIRQDIHAWLIKLRNGLKLSNIAFDPSTRRLKTCVDMCTGNLPHDVAFRAAFLGQLSQTELKKIGMEELEIEHKAIEEEI